MNDLRDQLLSWSPADFGTEGFAEVIRRFGVLSKITERELSDLFLLVLAEDLEEAGVFPELALLIGRELLKRHDRDRRLLKLLARLLEQGGSREERGRVQAQLDAIPVSDSELAVAAIARLNASNEWATLSRAEQLKFFERAKQPR